MNNRMRKRVGAALMAVAVVAVPLLWLLGVPPFSFKSYDAATSPDGSVVVWGFSLHLLFVLAGILGVFGFALFVSRKHEDTSA